MRILLCFLFVVLTLVLHTSCAIGMTASVGTQSAANVTANEMVYGTENDELTSTTAGDAVMNKSIARRINYGTTTVSDSVIFSGLVSGTVDCTHNETWTETDTTLILYERSFTYYGTRSVIFSDYSNVAGRTIQSGTVTVTVASSTPGTFVSSIVSGSPPAVGSVLGHTVTNVNKTIAGTVTVEQNGKTYTCIVELTIDVVSRVIDWTFDTSQNLTSPNVISRDVTVTGTVTVNGTIFTINTSLTTATPQ